MAAETLKIWTADVCLLSAPKILALGMADRSVTVKYLNMSPAAGALVRFVFKISGRNVSFEEANEYLSDLKEGDWTVGMKFQFDLPEMSKIIAAKLRRQPSYGRLTGILPAESLDLFIEMKVSETIFQQLKLLLMIEWNAVSGKSVKNIFLCRSSAVTRELASEFGKRDIRTAFYHDLFDLSFAVITAVKCKVREYVFFRELSANKGFSIPGAPSLAVHHAEGLNTKMRSDIFWMEGSGIDPSKVVLYIDKSKSSRLPVSVEACRSITASGASWVSLSDSAISAEVEKVRLGRVRCPHGITAFLANGWGAGAWYLSAALTLYSESRCWEVLYRRINAKAVIDIGAQTSTGIAQNAALKRIGGVRLGVQRSSLTFDSCLPYLVYNCNDIFFIWGKLTAEHRGTSKIIRECVISGYPFDSAFKDAKKESAVPAKEAGKERFVIALFDNVFSRELYFSPGMIKSFYTKFLGWLLEDESVVIVAKEKKPGYLDSIQGLKGMLKDAVATNRFIRLENPLGKLPVSASLSSDIAVGIGISSPVIETAIAGGRAVHCDTAGHGFHPYYKWGKDKVVFDDIDKLIASLKVYKNDPSLVPGLGDWKGFIDKIEPYRDGKSGERVGNYIKWLLDAFERGEMCDGAVSFADKMFAERWGTDKILIMGNKK